jgi:hypothetical protein
MKRILGAGFAGALFAFPASALTISNTDPDPHTVTVTVGTDSKQVTVAPNEEVDNICADGCMVQLENGEQYQMSGGETVSIEDGIIFVDTSPADNADDVPDVDPGDPDAADTGAKSTEAPAAGAPPADAAPAATAATPPQ